MLDRRGFCAFAIAGPALVRPAAAQVAPGQALRDVSVALGAVGFGTAPVPLALQLGLFEKHGLRLRTITMDSGAAAVTALLSGSTDAAMAGPGELITALGRGQRLVMLATAYIGSAGTLVLARSVAERLGVRPDAPATARLKALHGLQIATPSASSGYTATLKGATAAVGASVRFAYIAPTAMASALDSGAVQGCMAGAPSWAPPVVRGTGVVWLSGPKQEFPAANVPFSQGSVQVLAERAAADPDLMRRLAAAMEDFAHAVAERPDEVKAAVARIYPNLDAATLNVLFATEASAWKARQATAADVRHDIEFVRSGGIDLPHIDAVNPATVIFAPPVTR